MFPFFLSLVLVGSKKTKEIQSDYWEFDQEIPSQIVPNRIQNEPPSESLLSVLDDKNKIISNLKEQLHNQKMQLTYYFRRELSQDKIQQLSQSCSTEASEESLPLNLAMNKFCKQAGIKTKLSMLYERMDNIEYKITHTLKDQEFLLRKFVNKLCEGIKSGFEGFLADPYHINLIDKLLSATLSLRRHLNAFKICSERVLIVEEERNGIVEQVYSLPIEQRLSCNYLVGIQLEKAHLESEIKRISQNHETSMHGVNDVGIIEQILSNIHSTCVSSSEDCVGQMLEKINSEARDLLELTKKQKEKYETEVTKSKNPDPDKILLFIRAAFQDQQVLRNYTEDELKLFEMIRKEIEKERKKIRDECEQGIKQQQKEYDNLKVKLQQIMLDTSRTKVANETLKEEIEELKMEQKRTIYRLKQEKDAYKAQVEDLQAIREAYAQLVDRQPNIGQIERDFLTQISQRDTRILELEKVAECREDEIESLKARVDDQKDQITVLNRFINLTRPSSPTDETIPILLPRSHQEDSEIKKLANKSKLAKFKTLSPRKQRQIHTKRKQKHHIRKIFSIEQEAFIVSSKEEFNDELTTEKSSRFSLEIAFQNHKINETAYLEIDEYEMFKDASNESLLLDARYRQIIGLN